MSKRLLSSMAAGTRSRAADSMTCSGKHSDGRAGY
jgi:hypothetical protein